MYIKYQFTSKLFLYVCKYVCNGFAVCFSTGSYISYSNHPFPPCQVIAAGETDDEKLIDMILLTRQQMMEQGLADLVQMFILTAEYSRHCMKSRLPDTIEEECSQHSD